MLYAMKAFAAWGGPLVVTSRVLDDIKQAFLSLFYWAWTRVPRIDGFGTGTSIALYFFAGLLAVWLCLWVKGIRERRF